MDLALFVRVLWRFRELVAGGVIVAILLAVLAVARISPSSPHIAYRQSQQFSSEARVFVTQQGFPWGYASPPTASATPEDQAAAEAKLLGSKQFADPTRFPSLAVLYAYLAMSDPVKTLLRRSGAKHTSVLASPVVSTQSGYGTTLPLIAISATGTSPGAAQRNTILATKAFRTFLQDLQARNHIPDGNRVLLTVLTRASKATLVKGRSKTLPLVVFITVMIAVVGLAFLLENLRPAARTREGEPVSQLPAKKQTA